MSISRAFVENEEFPVKHSKGIDAPQNVGWFKEKKFMFNH